MTTSALPADVTLRPLGADEDVELFNRLPYSLNHELADDLAEGRRRPEWMWTATRGDQLLARVAWWGRPGDAAPLLLDVVDVDDASAEDLGPVLDALLARASAEVVPQGATPPEYGRFVPADWREQRAARRAVETRVHALERAGARLTVERLRLEWRPGTALPEPDPRLAFRSVDDTEEFLALSARILDGTLDFHSRADLQRMSARAAALLQYEEEFARYSTPREWWRIATLGEGGEAVGLVVPARNAYNPVIAYIGVLPEHRGRGYVDGVLAEGTRVLAAQSAPRIRAATDLGNVPMAAAFARAGYVCFERAVNMAWAA